MAEQQALLIQLRALAQALEGAKAGLQAMALDGNLVGSAGDAPARASRTDDGHSTGAPTAWLVGADGAWPETAARRASR